MPNQFKTLLIIEDDHDIRVALRQVFEAADFFVLSVANGLNALDLLKITAAPDLIICDLNMPIMDGETFVKEKIKIQKIKDVPVIVVSAHINRLCNLPDVVCIPKPLDMFVIVKLANDIINKSK